MDEEIREEEEREDPREEMTSEEEHRYDEYEGLSRKLDDAMGEIAAKFDDMAAKLDAIKAGVDGFVEAGAVIDEASEETESENLADIVEAAAVMDAFDDLDFTI